MQCLRIDVEGIVHVKCIIKTPRIYFIGSYYNKILIICQIIKLHFHQIQWDLEMIIFLRYLFSFYLKYVFSDWSTRHREIVSVKNERDVGTIDRIRLYQANYTIELRVC